MRTQSETFEKRNKFRTTNDNKVTYNGHPVLQICITSPNTVLYWERKRMCRVFICITVSRKSFLRANIDLRTVDSHYVIESYLLKDSVIAVSVIIGQPVAPYRDLRAKTI